MGTEFGDLLPGLAALADPVRGVDLRRVATLIGLSPSRAQRVIAEAIGESPKRFELRTRLDLGAVLLLATDSRVIDVALASGFGSHESFTRAFGDRFAHSPTEWRRRHEGALTADQARVAVSTSRCAGLYRRPLTRTTRKEPSMPYEINTRDLTPVPVLYQARKVEKEALGAALAEVLPAVFGYVMQSGLAPAGHPFVRHVGMSPAYLSIEAGIPLVEAPTSTPPPESGILTGELPGGLAAITTHRGPYEGLGEAYASIERWITETDAKSAGAPWELYLTDPAEVPDPADWLTEVCWPIHQDPTTS